ncbi:MAG: hypothetical protein GC156_05640 [Actinomycetales bacterium]|nr:hypothetical protein [Actinomycetales bacterium]
MSTGRRTVAGVVLAGITVLVLVVGVLDPAFGPLAILLGGALILTSWVVSRIAVPAMEIAAWGASLVLGLITVATWTLWILDDGSSPADSAPWWVWAMFAAYEAAIAVTAGGALWHLVRHVRVLRGLSPS